jgi:hypothetical protein
MVLEERKLIMNTIVVEQKAIVCEDLNKFRQELNEAFNDGWRIVPGTLAVAAANMTDGKVAGRYAAVVEK